MATKTYYAVVTFGPGLAGAGGVYASEQEAMDKIARAAHDTACGKGRYYSDAGSLASARVNGYTTRRAAKRADISDSAKCGLVSIRSAR